MPNVQFYSLLFYLFFFSLVLRTISHSARAARGAALKDKITNATLALKDMNNPHWPLRWRCEKGKDFLIQPNTITFQRNLI